MDSFGLLRSFWTELLKWSKAVYNLKKKSPKPIFFKSTFFRHPVSIQQRAWDQKVSVSSENMKWFPKDGCAMNNEARAICISRVREPQQHFV